MAWGEGRARGSHTMGMLGYAALKAGPNASDSSTTIHQLFVLPDLLYARERASSRQEQLGVNSAIRMCG